MPYDIRFEQHDSQPLAVVRRLGSLQDIPKVVPAACGLVWGVLRAQQIAGAGRHVSIYWDDEINMEVGVEVAAPFAGAGEVVGSATPAGRVATTTHFGPYQRLADAHQAIRSWCQTNGHALAGPRWEIYGHWLDAWNNDPSQIRTDVVYLLAPNSLTTRAD